LLLEEFSDYNLKSMDYRKIIADSWHFTQNNKRLIYWFGIFPSILTTTVGVGYLAYQFFAFKKSYLFDDSKTSFLSDVTKFGWDFISSHASLTVPLVIFAIIVFILWFFVPTITMAAAMQAIARAKNGQKSGVGTGLKYGIMVFLPLLELHTLVKTFSPMSILTEMGFVLRNLGPAIFKMLLPVFLIIFVLGLIFLLLFTFADLYIIIDDKKVLDSIKKSVKLVILNWQHTVLISILMLIIGIRIIIQAFLVFLIPAIIILLGGYLATLTLGVAVYIVAGVIAVAALALAIYLGGVVDIFSYTVWTFAFLELTSEKEVSARGEIVSAREEVASDEKGAASARVKGGTGSVPTEASVRTIETAPVTDVTKKSSNIPDLTSSDDSIPGLL